MDLPLPFGSSSVRGVKKKNKRRYCCVKDCHNCEGDDGIKFYRFPSRPWEVNRRLKWIVAVRRVNGDDLSHWSPNNNTRICSRHFVNEEKSNIENHPGYLPTIFPPVYKKRSTVPAAQISRFSRWMHRSAASATAAPCAAEVAEFDAEDASSSAISVAAEVTGDSIDAAAWDGLNVLCAAAEVHVAARSVETQTSETSSVTTRFSVFICCTEGNNLSTQITHHETRDCEVQHIPNVASKHSGPDHRTSYFAGHESVSRSTSALEDLCNVSQVVFAVLLSVFPVSTESRCDVSKEDRLLLFLMKLRLGISYSSLATLFSISVTST
ncbi:THAP domain-containing protein 11-like [Dermacentor albipictus]|uniref:THAP domain-containing protein 11-like n=1 Tax=Dermacentor albipictus TaxID=60249 RepID=UPI0031FE3BFD